MGKGEARVRRVRAYLEPERIGYPEPYDPAVGDTLVVEQKGGPRDGEALFEAVIRKVSTEGDITFEVTKTFCRLKVGAIRTTQAPRPT